MRLLAFRNLADPGGPAFSEAQAATVASAFQVTDGPNDQGEMFQRPGKLADRFPPPFPNDQAARAAMSGGLPPDMSVLAKARSYEAGFPWFIFDAFTQYQEDGPDYIHAILNGYEDPPPGLTLPPGSQYNKYFPGHAIAMPKPLILRLRVGQLCRHSLKRLRQVIEIRGIGLLGDLLEQRSEPLLRLCVGQLRRAEYSLDKRANSGLTFPRPVNHP
jgi:cytochrome c1